MRHFTLLLLMILPISVLYGLNGQLSDKGQLTSTGHQEVSPHAGETVSYGESRSLGWDILMTFEAYASVGGENAVTTDGTHIYTASFAHNIMRKYDLQGNFLDSFTIDGITNIRDFTYDGEFYYASSGENFIYQLDLADQTLISTIPTPDITTRHLSHDPEADHGAGGFWTGDWDDLYLVDKGGNIIEGPITNNINDLFGSAYDPWTEGGPYLWFFSQTLGSSDYPLHFTNIEQWDIDNQEFSGEAHQAEDIPGYNIDDFVLAGGIVGTTKLFPGTFSLLGSIQQSPNLIFAYEVVHLAEPASPTAVSDLQVIPGDYAALNATLSWTNPNETIDGSPINELTAINIYRNNVLVHTISDPDTGDEESYFDDNITANGLYEYWVRAVNDEGEGFPAISENYIGHDAPGFPLNISLSSLGNFGHITWLAPDIGMNGGYIDQGSVLYDIIRHPDEVEVATDFIGTSFTDEDIPEPGAYYYEVIPHNETGTGFNAFSNTAVLSMGPVYLYETFDDPENLPFGWHVQADVVPSGKDDIPGIDNWFINDNDFAGGEAPELRFLRFPAFDSGYSRMITESIHIDGNTHLELRLQHYLNNLSINDDGQIAIEYSTDEGDTWEVIWSHDAVSNVGPQEDTFPFDVPGDTEEINIGFRYSGDSRAIFTWNLDNIILRAPFTDDLSLAGLSGPPVIQQNESFTWEATVMNEGESSQDTYTVSLMAVQDNDNIELANEAGPYVESGEMVTIELEWTPSDDFEEIHHIYAVVELEEDQNESNTYSEHVAIYVFKEDDIPANIGTGNHNTLPRVPFDFYFTTHYHQLMYYPDEFESTSGFIKGILLQSNFLSEDFEDDVSIWLGTTQEDNFDTAGDFIPTDDFIKVYDGSIEVHQGRSFLYIPFQAAFEYTGAENMVVATNRPFDADNPKAQGQDKFIGMRTEDHPARTRKVQSHHEEIDPDNPQGGTTSDWMPNISFLFNSVPMGGITGIITNQYNNPVEGVKAEVEDEDHIFYSTPEGYYEFLILEEGTATVHFSKDNYEEKTFDISIIGGENISHDVVMELMEPDLFDVVFDVVDIQGEPLESATIIFDDEENVPGDYVFPETEPGTYQYEVSKDGHHPAEGELTVEDEDVYKTIVLETDDVNISEVLSPETEIFPNPAKSKLTVRSDYDMGNLRIIDMVGQVVYQSHDHGRQVSITVSHLHPGMYFLQVKTRQGLSTHRVQIAN